MIHKLGEHTVRIPIMKECDSSIVNTRTGKPLKGLEKVGTRTASVSLTIDTDKLDALFRKAARNKGGKATLQFGGVTAQVVSTTDIPEVHG